jgi:uncharacterized protein
MPLRLVEIVMKVHFQWDPDKDLANQRKHGVSFLEAQYAFAAPHRLIAEGVTHSDSTQRYCCSGKVASGILTVRFAYRNEVIRIFGAGYWRKGKVIYENENKIHRRTAGGCQDHS